MYWSRTLPVRRDTCTTWPSRDVTSRVQADAIGRYVEHAEASYRTATNASYRTDGAPDADATGGAHTTPSLDLSSLRAALAEFRSAASRLMAVAEPYSGGGGAVRTAVGTPEAAAVASLDAKLAGVERFL